MDVTKLQESIKELRSPASHEKKVGVLTATTDQWTSASYTVEELVKIGEAWGVTAADIKVARNPSKRKPGSTEQGMAALLVLKGVPFIPRASWCTDVGNGFGSGSLDGGGSGSSATVPIMLDTESALPKKKKQKMEPVSMEVVSTMLDIVKAQERLLREREAMHDQLVKAQLQASGAAQMNEVKHNAPSDKDDKVSSDGVSSSVGMSLEGTDLKVKEVKTGPFSFVHESVPLPLPMDDEDTEKVLSQLESSVLESIISKKALADLRKARPNWAGKPAKDGMAMATITPGDSGFTFQAAVAQPDMAMEDFIICLNTYLFAVAIKWKAQALRVMAYQYQLLQLRQYVAADKLQNLDLDWRRAIASHGWDWSHGFRTRETLIIGKFSESASAPRNSVQSMTQGPVHTASTSNYRYAKKPRSGVSQARSSDDEAHSALSHGTTITTISLPTSVSSSKTVTRLDQRAVLFCVQNNLCKHMQVGRCRFEMSGKCTFGHYCMKCIANGKERNKATEHGAHECSKH